MTDGNPDRTGEHSQVPPPGYQPSPSPPGYPQPGQTPHGAPSQPPPGYAVYGQPTYGRAAQNHGQATAAMVIGIVGLASMLFCYGLVSIITGPIAFFMGRSAQKEINASPHSWSNAGMARAGWIMGLIQTILSLLVLIAVATFFIWAFSVDDADF